MRAAVVLLLLVTGSARASLADVAVGLELAELRRSVAVFASSSERTASYDSLSGFVGFDWGNSMFYVSQRNEETRFDRGRFAYGKKETSFDWHWNEQTQKASFTNVSVGVFRSEYEIEPLATEEFWGLGVGVGATKEIWGEHLFFAISGKVKLPYTDDERFLEADQSARVFVGLEGRVGFGVAFADSRVAVLAGYRVQEIDFDERFVDDSSEGPYIAARVFFGAN